MSPTTDKQEYDNYLYTHKALVSGGETACIVGCCILFSKGFFFIFFTDVGN